MKERTPNPGIQYHGRPAYRMKVEKESAFTPTGKNRIKTTNLMPKGLNMKDFLLDVAS